MFKRQKSRYKTELYPTMQVKYSQLCVEILSSLYFSFQFDSKGGCLFVFKKMKIIYLFTLALFLRKLFFQDTLENLLRNAM